MTAFFQQWLDDRDQAQLLAALLSRRLGYLPEWFLAEKGSDIAILEILARYQSMLLQRLNQAPEKHKLAFLDLLGVELIPAQSARVPIVFQLAAQAADGRLLAGTQVAAPPPPESSQQIIFETERATGLAAAKIQEVFSLWPGRDQYIDHSSAFLAAQSFQPFLKRQLQDTPHILYIAHNTLLALKGNIRLDVIFELTQGSDEHLDLLWEYWDGQVWRGFKAMHPYCEAVGEEKQDGTDGLTRSGKFRLETDCAEAQKTTVNGIEAYWIRSRLTEPLPLEPEKLLPEVDGIKLRSLITRPLLCTTLQEYRVTFDPLVPNTRYSRQDFAAGDVIFVENGVVVSVQDFKFVSSFENPNDADRFCEVTPSSTGGFGTKQYVSFQNINLQFDFTALEGAVQSVQFEFSPAGGEENSARSEENLAVNGEPILVRNLAPESNNSPIISSAIAPGIKLTVTPSNNNQQRWLATLTGSIDTLLVGGRNGFSIDNVLIKAVKSEGFLPDKAFADVSPLDLSKSFYPLGQQPQPGNVFYFTSEELFSKPKAQAHIFLRTAPTPAQSLNLQSPEPDAVEEFGIAAELPSRIAQRSPLSHKLVWEYWNGRTWVAIALQPTQTARQPDFEADGLFAFTVPEDMEPTTVNDEEARWMRARLERGGYGFTAKIAWTDPRGLPNEFTYVVPQPPALSDFRLCYTWQYGPFHPEHVITYNDFQHEDHTDEAIWPGVTFQPFRFVSDVTPAIYLGFDQKPPVDRLNLYFDLVERRGDTRGPELRWEYWDGINWQIVSVEDETRFLRVPGMVSWIGTQDSQPFARFKNSLHWLRARLKADEPPGEPMINRIFLNAVWAAQQQTIQDDPLGASSGQPNQVFRFVQIPVLAGEQIEVRELAGARANVEWRILAMELFGDARVMRSLETQLAAEGTQTDVILAPLRLKRDRQKRVTEAWVTWQPRRFLHDSGPNDRHYLLERARGRLTFGDGDRGKIPPLGAAILAKRYRTGGGLSGNLNSHTITQVLGAVPGLESVFNPLPSEGGADAETLDRLSTRGPQTLRHQGRAITAADYETMAKEASPAVAVARAIPTTDVNGLSRPGWVTLVIIPYSEAPRPYPSFGMRQQVQKFIEARTAADLAASGHFQVVGPSYLPVDVEVTVVPLDATEAGAVEQRVCEALSQFLNPLRGSPDGHGWTPGRDVFLSDVASVVERVSGVDYAKAIALLIEGALQGDRIAIAPDRIVVAGDIRIRLELQ
jgi:hypothetical protein